MSKKPFADRNASRIFDSYGQMDVSVQEAIQDLITALIRSLGPSHAKLLTLMRTFPPGAETLALRVLTIFTETGRPTAAIVSLVKGLMSERELDARFLIPIIAEMDKVCTPLLLIRIQLNCPVYAPGLRRILCDIYLISCPR